jgi:subtilisin family serine protease
MKQFGAGLLFVLFSSFTFAASADTYVVALERGGIAPQRLFEHETAEFRTLNAYAVELSEDEAADLRRAPNVRYVERAAERHLLGLLPASDTTQRNLLGQTLPFGLEIIRAPEVWSVTRGQSINVVVIDTGIDHRHPDLAGVYAGGYNALTKTSDPLDDNGHGTHVSGTIAAADNDFGVVGIASNVRLWGVKVLGADGKGSTANVIAALDWVIQKKRALGGNWILNLSLGSAEPNTAEREAFARAVDEGLLIFAASGNESKPLLPAPVDYPAGYPGVVAVGAIDDDRDLAGFSNQGPELALVAPGVGVLSTLRVGSGSLAAVKAEEAAFAGQEITGSAKGTVSGSFVFCGLGKAGEFPASVNGRIALIKRGEIAFAEKTRNARNAGASAVVIFNHDDSPLNWTLISETDPSSSTFPWPVTVALPKEAGESLLRNPSSQLTVTFRDDDYGVFNGTSMAAPHAAGAAALIWSVAPSAPASAVRNAITATAGDLGSGGLDPAYGYGVVDVLSAARMLAPGAFGTAERPARRRITRRGR